MEMRWFSWPLFPAPLPGNGNVIPIYVHRVLRRLWIASSAMPLCHRLTSFSHLSRERKTPGRR